MALSDNPYVGLPLSQLQSERTLWMQVQDDIAKAGKSHAFPGFTMTRADLAEVRNTLSLLRVAIEFTSGTVKQVAYARINTSTKFTGQTWPSGFTIIP